METSCSNCTIHNRKHSASLSDVTHFCCSYSADSPIRAIVSHPVPHLYPQAPATVSSSSSSRCGRMGKRGGQGPDHSISSGTGRLVVEAVMTWDLCHMISWNDHVIGILESGCCSSQTASRIICMVCLLSQSKLVQLFYHALPALVPLVFVYL